MGGGPTVNAICSSGLPSESASMTIVSFPRASRCSRYSGRPSSLASAETSNAPPPRSVMKRSGVESPSLSAGWPRRALSASRIRCWVSVDTVSSTLSGSGTASHGERQRVSSPSLQQPLFGVSQKEPSPSGAQSALVVHFGTEHDGALPQRMSPSALRMQRQSPASLHVCLTAHDEASVQAWDDVSSGTQWHPVQCSPDGQPK